VRLRDGSIDLAITCDLALGDDVAFRHAVDLAPFVMVASDHQLIGSRRRRCG
jgi:hypothetical protein